jgi:putative NADH-flavin reductase
MKITILGPTGPTGRQLVGQALARGHEVTAFARRPAAPPVHPGLVTVTGSIADAAALDGAIAGREAVLCALGGRPWRRRERVCSTAMRHAVDAMQRHHVRRVVAISTFGAGDTRPRTGWLVRHLVFGAVLRSEVADKEAMEAILENSGLDWTVVRVGLLHDGPARGTWRAADDASIHGMGRISRADVAAFMLDQLDDARWLRRKPALMD